MNTLLNPDVFLWLSHESYRLKQDVQRTTTPLSPKISERIAHSFANSFTLTHCLADLLAMHHDPMSIPLCIQHHPTHIPFIPSESTLPFLSNSNFNIFTLKIQNQGHGWGQSLKAQCESNILLTHIPFFPCQSAIPFLRSGCFKIWPWIFKVKVMGEVNVESHKVGVTSYRLTCLSFHVNRPFHSWHTAFSKFDLENPRSRSNDHDVAQLQV